MDTDLILLKDVRRMAGGVSRSTIGRWVRKGTFPAPIVMGPRVTRWRRGDVEKWVEARAVAVDLRVEL